MFEERGRLILAICIGVLLPWILILIFLYFLGSFPALLEAANGNPLTFFTLLIFYSFNLTYELPVLGTGFWLVFIAWAIPGIFIGLLTRDLKKNLLVATLGFLVTFILYNILVFSTSIPPALIDPIISSSLYHNFSWVTPFLLLFHSAFTCFVLPILFFATLTGGLLKTRFQSAIIPKHP